MDFSWLENRSWRSRESVKETGRKKEREKEGEGKCQLLLECRSNVQQKGRGRCVCVCVCAQGQWVLCSVQAAPFQRCVELCWQPSDCGLKLLASLDACLKQSSTAFQNSVSTLWELY